MSTALYVDLHSALGTRKSITVSIRDIERTMGDDWLLELSAQAHKLDARVDPHRTDHSLVSITRN